MQIRVAAASSSLISKHRNSWFEKVNFIFWLYISSHWRIYSFLWCRSRPGRDSNENSDVSLRVHPLFLHHVWDFAHSLYNLNLKWKESIRQRASSHNGFHYWSTCRKSADAPQNFPILSPDSTNPERFWETGNVDLTDLQPQPQIGLVRSSWN